MTYDDAFLQAIIDNPTDNHLRLIYADWLEEHDDPRRGELLRLLLNLSGKESGRACPNGRSCYA